MSKTPSELKTFRNTFEAKKRQLNDMDATTMSLEIENRLDWLIVAEEILKERGGFDKKYDPRKCSYCGDFSNSLMTSARGELCPSCYDRIAGDDE